MVIFMKYSVYRPLLAVLLCLAMVLPLSGCGEARMQQRSFSSMNTMVTLTAYGKNAEAGLRAAEGVITAVHNMVDPKLPTSTAYAINNARGESIVVPAQVAKMLTTAATVYQQSGGALDLSIYPLVKRWGFEDKKYYVPTDEEIFTDKAKLCFDQMVLTSFPSTGAYAVSFPEGAELTIESTGSGEMAAQGGGGGYEDVDGSGFPGIGSVSEHETGEACGSITINGGTVSAFGK